MVAHHRLRPAAGLLALLPFIGLWIGHTLEYLRVTGATPAFADVAFGSIHAYMLPAALVLAIAAVLFAADLLRLWAELGARLDAAGARLRAMMRGRPVAPPAAACADPIPSLASRLAVAWPLLAVLQIVLYLIQENLEAVTSGMGPAGLAPVSGPHALAPLVQAATALVLTTAAGAVTWLLRRRVRAVARIDAIVAVLIRALRERSARKLAVPRTVFPRRELRCAAHFGRAPPSSVAA